MGMFDSLYIEREGRERELQTKRFDCILNNYRVGEWVAGSPPGVRIFFDPLRLDAAGKRVYRDDAECARETTVFDGRAGHVIPARPTENARSLNAPKSIGRGRLLTAFLPQEHDSAARVAP